MDQARFEKSLQASADIEIQDSTGRTPLLVAAQSDNTQALSRLLEAGASPLSKDKMGQTALYLAVNGSIELSSLLIKAKADVNAKSVGGVTPLMLAAGTGKMELVKLLLSPGCCR